MYLISLYFDEKTNQRIQQYISQVARKTGNMFMPDGNVPPHITISAFETTDESLALQEFYSAITELYSSSIQWVSVGEFFPHVIYLTPVLNAYLHQMSEKIYTTLTQNNKISVSPYYRPFQWIPHTTIGKTLSKEQMVTAFQTMQHQFGPFTGQVTKIGLAKTNPYTNLAEETLPTSFHTPE